MHSGDVEIHTHLRYAVRKAVVARRPLEWGLIYANPLACIRAFGLTACLAARLTGQLHTDFDLAGLRDYPPFEQLIKPKG